MSANRRQFLKTATIATVGAAATTARTMLAKAKEPKNTRANHKQVVSMNVPTADALQAAMIKQSTAGGGIIRLAAGTTVTCVVRQDSVAAEASAHALLVPEGIELDLNGGNLLLDLRSSSYGIRLSNHSAIRNGSVRVIRSEGLPRPAEQCQAIWHSAISVGAAYGSGGTVAKPGHYSTVSDWAMENLVIEQTAESSCIQLMSQACHGRIRNVHILDSAMAKIGIGLDWGTVGPVGTADETVPQMKKLWEKNEISSTHPHHVLIENITIGNLGRSVDGNDAGVRCSGCHHITIKNLQIESANCAIALFGGDFGFEFAPDEQRKVAHAGYLIDGVKIKKARLYGLVLNGAEDNVYRSCLNHGYKSIRDPVHPGLDKPIIRNAVLRGVRKLHSRGVYVTATSGATFEKVDVSQFETGVAVRNWVRSLRFRKGRIADNQSNIEVGGATEEPVDVVFENNAHV
jgi:hypothetical protein